MNFKRISKTAAIGLLFTLLGAQQAHADGFLAETFIKPFNPGLARQLDQANARLGNPVDHAIAAGANVVAPGAGTALEAGWALQRSGVFNVPAVPVGMGQPMPPQMSWGRPAAGVPMGNLCATPAGAFPGPFNPVGMPCMTPVGPGVVVQALR